MSLIYSCYGEKHKSKNNVLQKKLLLHFRLKKDFYYINKLGKKIVLFTNYNFIWIYMVILTKNESYDKYKKIKCKSDEITEFVYFDIIYRKEVYGGENFFEYWKIL